MGVLKKIKASSLVETLVATVIVVLVFAIGSHTLNTLFVNSVISNTDPIEAQLRILEYKYMNGSIETPYYDDFKGWEISVEKVHKGKQSIVMFEAIQLERNKQVYKSRLHDNY